MEYLTDLIKKLGDLSFGILIKLVACIAIVLIGSWLIRFILKNFSQGRLYKHLDESLRRFLVSFLRVILYVVLFMTAASVVGIPMASFVTLLASAGVAIGLALQGSLSNLAGGVMILIFKPFKIGDYIEVSSGGGTVKDITVFYTKLCTADNKMITVPNGQLTNSAVTNYSSNELRRVDMLFTVSYDSDIDKVVSLLIDIADKHSLILKDPAPFSALTAQNDRLLEFSLRAWCKNGDYWTVFCDLQKSVKKTFDDNNIQIPYPRMEIYNK